MHPEVCPLLQGLPGAMLSPCSTLLFPLDEADAVAGAIARERGRALIGRAVFEMLAACKKSCGQHWVGGTLIVLRVLIKGAPSGRLQPTVAVGG